MKSSPHDRYTKDESLNGLTGDPEWVFNQLMQVIEQRRENPADRSYTTFLFRGGVEKIGAKILEEAAEVVSAAKESPGDEKRTHVVYETGDLIYHLFVLLGHEGISLSEVADELMRRFGTSGLDEKSSRPAEKGP